MTNKVTFRLGVITALIILALQNIACAQGNNQVFKAGAAKSSITPTRGMSELKGRNIHDNLYVKTIVLDDGNNRIAFLVADNQGIPTWIIEIAKSKIQESTGIPASNIIISATHTHSGIVTANTPANLSNSTPTQYQTLLINRMVESTKRAIDNLQPAKIGWSSIKKPEYVFNRRWYMKKMSNNPFGLLDSVMTNPGFSRYSELVKPAGPVDPQIWFVSLKSKSGEHIAVLANYSLHYVGGVEKNDISADYYGVFDKELAQILKAQHNSTEFIGIMSNGTSGDVNNINYNENSKKHSPYEKINIIAKEIATGVAKEIEKTNFLEWVPIEAKTNILNLKLRTPDNRINNSIAKLSSSKSKGSTFHTQANYYAIRVNNLTRSYPKIIEAPITTFTIGDLAISGVPFEVFAETGLELKNKVPFKDYFTIGLANGHWGYLPTPDQYKKGGYETWLTVSRAEEKASEKIVKQILSQLNELKESN